MSSFGSSVINKSQKKLAPKAPVHRRRPVPSTQTSEKGNQARDLETGISQIAQNANPRVGNEPISLQDGSQRIVEQPAPTSGPALSGSQPLPPRNGEASFVGGSRKRRRIDWTAQDASNPVHDSSTISAQPTSDSNTWPRTKPATYKQPTATRSSSRLNRYVESEPATNSVTEQGPYSLTRLNSSSGATLIPPSNTPQIHNQASNIYRGSGTRRNGPKNRISGRFATKESQQLKPGIPKVHSNSNSEPSTATRRRKERTTITKSRTVNENDEIATIARSRQRNRGSQEEIENATANSTQALHEEGTDRSRTQLRRSGRRQLRENESIANASENLVVYEEPELAFSVEDEPASMEDPANPSINLEDRETIPRKERQAKKATPEGAEEHEIDPGTLTMYELCRDSRKGRKSRLEAEMQEIDWAEVVRRRKDIQARARAGETIPRPETENDEDPSTIFEEARPQGPQLKLVNGQIVVDTSSLLVDRHAGARPDEAQPAVEEHDITRRVNLNSWINDNRKDPDARYRISNKSDPWSLEATEAFYSALRMFGTDFMMISKMFPGRTRRHIKLKFVREERANPAKIKEALIGGSVPMNLQVYCEATGECAEDYKDPEVLDKELKAEEEHQRVEIEKQKEEQAEIQRKKQESAAAKVAAGRQRKTGNKSAPKSRKRGLTRDAPNEEAPAEGGLVINES